MDTVSKKARSKIMSKIKSKNTKPEMLLRKALSKQGARYRIHYGKEKIDIAFPSRKLAVFVDGCFWHGCPLHFHTPKSNKEYWIPKLKRNLELAEKKNARLKAEGWTVLHIWEHSIKNNVDKCTQRILSKFNLFNYFQKERVNKQ